MDLFKTYNQDNKQESCVVVFSGGQDSTTCLGVALQFFKKVHCIAFTYGQKHTVEVICARAIAAQFENVTFETCDINGLGSFSDSALISGNKGSVNDAHTRNAALPASFVPNRNAMFLTLAHAYAQKLGATSVITGVCETDYSGYPDCRRDFIDAIQYALNIGSLTDIRIFTPLMHLNKAQTFHLAEEVGILDEVINMSHTCYNGKREGDFYHEWGHGCGECPACELRKKGFAEFINGK